MRITWNDHEDDALQGLPLSAQVFYLRGLRRLMDFETGLVGVSSRVSWAGLSTVVEVEPHQGLVGSGRPGREQVRRLVGWLVRAGLVEMRSDAAGKRLIFFLPMADRGSSATNNPDRNPTVTRPCKADRQGDIGFASEINGLVDNADIKADRNPTVTRPSKADTYPVSGKSKDSLPARARVEDADSAGAMARELRLRYVDVHSGHPELVRWVSVGVSTAMAVEAVAVVRSRSGAPERIPARYLGRVIDDLRKKPVGENVVNLRGGGDGACGEFDGKDYSSGATRAADLPAWARGAVAESGGSGGSGQG